jgi:hypothetical protein
LLLADAKGGEGGNGGSGGSGGQFVNFHSKKKYFQRVLSFFTRSGWSWWTGRSGWTGKKRPKLFPSGRSRR